MSLPVFPLNTVLFPGAPLPLRVFEERYVRMLRDRVANDPIFGIALIRSGTGSGDEPTFHRVGTTARLVSINVHGSDVVDIVVVGDRRIVLGEGDWGRGYAVADADDLPDRDFDRRQATIRLGEARASLDSYISAIAQAVGASPEAPRVNLEVESGSFEIISHLPLHTWEQQDLLEDRDPQSRINRALSILRRELTLLRRGGFAGVPVRVSDRRFGLN